MRSPNADIVADCGERHDRLAVDLAAGRIENLTRGKSYSTRPIPPFMEQLIRQGGLVEYIRKEKLAAR